MMKMKTKKILFHIVMQMLILVIDSDRRKPQKHLQSQHLQAIVCCLSAQLITYSKQLLWSLWQIEDYPKFLPNWTYFFLLYFISHLIELQTILVWKWPLAVILPNLLFKQCRPQQAAQDHAQSAFEDLQGRRPHNLSGQPVPVLCHLYSRGGILLLACTSLVPKFDCFALKISVSFKNI